MTRLAKRIRQQGVFHHRLLIRASVAQVGSSASESASQFDLDLTSSINDPLEVEVDARTQLK